jgi:hypothetical protein
MDIDQQMHVIRFAAPPRNDVLASAARIVAGALG